MLSGDMGYKVNNIIIMCIVPGLRAKVRRRAEELTLVRASLSRHFNSNSWGFVCWMG